jgi:trimeric autotransporter adhesin
MKYSPSVNPNVCRLNPLSVNDTISSAFNNYVFYKWQRSTDGGTIWTDVTGPLGPASPTFNGTTYNYVTTYTIPPANTDTSDNGDLYRVIVATTFANLSSINCMSTDGTSIITLSVTNCGIPLKTDLLSFNGRLVNDKGNLSWTTSKEDEPVTFTIERSNDGNNFASIGSVNSHNNYMAATNSYSLIDPVPVTGKVYYRLAVTDQQSAQKYSRTIDLTRQGSGNFGLTNIINPFYHSVEFDITAQNESKVVVELIDLFGKVVLQNSYTVRNGINALSLPNTERLPSGTYILRVKNNETLINRKLLKKNF